MWLSIELEPPSIDGYAQASPFWFLSLNNTFTSPLTSTRPWSIRHNRYHYLHLNLLTISFTYPLDTRSSQNRRWVFLCMSATNFNKPAYGGGASMWAPQRAMSLPSSSSLKRNSSPGSFGSFNTSSESHLSRLWWSILVPYYLRRHFPLSHSELWLKHDIRHWLTDVLCIRF